MRHHAIWAALSLAAVAPLGHAASNASAGLSDFHFQLEDLNQFDGWLPATVGCRQRQRVDVVVGFCA